MRPLHLTFICALAACTASAEQVAPPQYDFYFPTGMVLSPDERFLFVISANSDLRYSAGTLHVIDLDQVDATANAWRDSGAKPAECDKLADRPTVLGCKTTLDDGAAGPSVVGTASVEIGNFGVAVAVQPLEQGGQASSILRLFATVRGDPSVTYMDFDTGARTMSCGGSGTTPRCDEPHRLARFRGDSTLPVLSPEPFDVAVDVPGQNVFVTHLTTGEVTLVSAPIEVGSTPVLEDSIASLWALNRVSLTVGAVGIAPRLPGDPRGLVYVTSRAEARVAMVHVVPGPPTSTGQPTEALVRSGSFFYNGLESNGLPGDARNIAFSADGNRAYLVNRTPPSLQVYDTSIDDTGQPVNQFLGGVTVCSLPATVSLADFGEGLRAAIPCFLTGEVWILDPERRELISVEDAGRGPNGIAASTRHRKLYVGNYAEDTLMVIDVAPGSRMQNRAVLRLGQPRPLGNQ